jgi:adenine-specific DNA methylase
MLPCKYCRESYQIYYKYFPIDPFLDSREGVCYWLYKLHGLINQKIYKNDIKFEDVIRNYENIRAKCGTMSRDGDLDKKYKTCQSQSNKIDQEYLNNFLNKANSYEPITKQMIDQLYKSKENPNKECLKYQKKKNLIYNIYYN